MFSFRERTPHFWDFSAVPLLPAVASFLPERLACSACRWRAYKVASGDADSRCGRAVFLVDVLSILLLLTCFVVASLPQYREQAPGVFAASALPSAVERTVSLACAGLYAALYAVRLACVTALPSREELAGLAAQVQREEELAGARGGGGGGGQGSGGRSPLLPPSRQRLHALTAAAPSLLQEEAWEDSEEEEEETAEERSAYAAAAAAEAAAAAARDGGGTGSAQPCSYSRGGLQRAALRLLHFALLPSSLMDLLSFLPVALDAALGAPPALLLLRALRFLRVLRLLRATSETLSFRLVRRSLHNASGALCFSLVPTLCVVLAFFSAAIFYCEGGEWREVDVPVAGYYRPDVSGTGLQLSPFRSVVHTAWFVMVTLSTLGYGDMTPTSAVGKVVTTAMIATGIM